MRQRLCKVRSKTPPTVRPDDPDGGGLDEAAGGSSGGICPVDPDGGGTRIDGGEQAFLTEMRISLARGHASVPEDLPNDV